jgi:pSer/pThr/pTyr-binding forkhead associated (FHA) protein
VRDLDSANGTRVNGARIQAEGAVLEEGDVIAIGETQLVFHR